MTTLQLITKISNRLFKCCSVNDIEKLDKYTLTYAMAQADLMVQLCMTLDLDYSIYKRYSKKIEKELLHRANIEIPRQSNDWELLSLSASQPPMTIETFNALIDDASAMGFEFKVSDGNIYFREIEQ